MTHIKKILSQSPQEVAASLKTSPTVAGRTNTDPEVLIDTINQVFSLFRVNYHNQFHAAFADTQLLNQAKRLWKETLQDYQQQHILGAARRVIEESDYLPTLKKMLTACEAGWVDYGLPDVRQAYLEAANAAHPKNAQRWSHPIVYLAGKNLGWYYLSHSPESITFPVYSKAYRTLANQFINGADFEVDHPPQLTHSSEGNASAETVERQLQHLRNILGN